MHERNPGARLRTAVDRFEELYGPGTCRLFRAPGRVNLIGEHTDYNDGFVLPMAIDLDVVIAARPRDDRGVRVYSSNYGEGVRFSLDAVTRDPRRPWSDYVRGVVFFFNQAFPAARGMDAVIDGTVPIGSGLSSSAAVETATAVALQGVNGLSMDRREMALLCQRAENEFVGARCGIMDQLVSACGRRGAALLLDCRSLESQAVPIPEDVVIAMCDTKKRRELASSEYNRRRAECEEAVRILGEAVPGVKALRDVAPEAFEARRHLLPDPLDRRAEHVVYENRRVQTSVAALRARDLAGLGREMAASHESLRTRYEVSCAELDAMVRIAAEVAGCLGARMTGGGFGGCTVNVVRRDAVPEFVAAVKRRYRAETGIAPAVYVSAPSDGAGEVFPEG
ncbi:MAG: galactokinase [Gemmatimonadetes bacterium]|nr:galactokinase [Gemmatimonadota bacterium]